MLLGRTANGLYWMNRYIERAENMARLLDAGLRMALTRTESAAEEWTSVVVSAGCRTGVPGPASTNSPRPPSPTSCCATPAIRRA